MSNSNVIGVKLTNGLEIVAKLDTETDTVLNLVDAFFLQTKQSSDGSFNVDYVPLTILGAPTNKNHPGFDVALPRTTVLFTYQLNPALIEQYLTYTSVLDLSQAPSIK